MKTPAFYLIHQRRVRAYALYCAQARAHKFTRVSASFYQECDTILKNYIAHHIRSMPSKGRTIT